jgi:hypothetical protein
MDILPLGQILELHKLSEGGVGAHQSTASTRRPSRAWCASGSRPPMSASGSRSGGDRAGRCSKSTSPRSPTPAFR